MTTSTVQAPSGERRVEQTGQKVASARGSSSAVRLFWIYITGSTVAGDGYSIAVFNGDIIGAESNLFVGVPSGESVNLGGEWRGTVVAPRGNIHAEPYTNATLRGSFFSASFELFEARWLYHVSFTRPWVPQCTGSDGFTNCS